MTKSIKSLNEVKIPETYELVNGEYVKEVDSFMLTLKHKLSGARVLIFSNEDDNKVFDIAFRTPPKDATGVPHIIEHTVLCGSEKYPAKDPFVELVKGSLNTYLNATTYPDKTMYPVASYNDKDFANLMPFSIQIYISMRKSLSRRAGTMSLRARMHRLPTTVLFTMK